MKRTAIIVAGGNGSRMQADMPKQFMELCGKPVMMHTIEAFWNAYGDEIDLVVVLNVDYHDQWEKLIRKYHFEIPHTLVKGGTTRFQSVKNGLKLVSKNTLVAVHDAVRPLVSTETIQLAYNEAEAFGNAVPVIPVRDSIRRSYDNTSEALNREQLFIVQTPQVFHSEVLIKAYQQEFRNEFTDDASVVERNGEKIRLITGEQRNIKITYTEDLVIADAFLRHK